MSNITRIKNTKYQSHPFYLLFISHNCSAAKLSSFYAGFKTGIHLKKHRFINIARSHCSIFINRKKIKTLKINYIAFYITLL